MEMKDRTAAGTGRVIRDFVLVLQLRAGSVTR